MLCVHSSLTLRVHQHGKGRDLLPMWVQSYGTHPTVLPGQHHPQDVHRFGQHPHLQGSVLQPCHTVQSSQAIPQAFLLSLSLCSWGITLSSLG